MVPLLCLPSWLYSRPSKWYSRFCVRALNLTDPQLLTYFDIHFPQKLSWRLCQLSKPMNTMLISVLFKTLSKIALVRNLPTLRIPIRPSGINIASNMESIQTSKPMAMMSPNLQSLSLQKDIDPGNFSQETILSLLTRFLQSCAQLGRRLQRWGTWIKGCLQLIGRSILD